MNDLTAGDGSLVDRETDSDDAAALAGETKRIRESKRGSQMLKNVEISPAWENHIKEPIKKLSTESTYKTMLQ